MKLLYFCEKCRKNTEVVKEDSESREDEKCFCGWVMKFIRKITNNA